MLFTIALSPWLRAAGEEIPQYLQGRDLYPTYSEGVGLILERRCNMCHRPGGSAPISFVSYEEVREWARGAYTPIDAVIKSREMPPWPADPEVGGFENSLYLAPKEMELLLEWIAEGYPYGEEEFKPSVEYIEGWNIGRPDAVFELPEHTLGEDARSEVIEFTLQTNFVEDRWIVASEARPGNEFLVTAIEGGPLGSYQSGNGYEVLPKGLGRLLRAGENVRVRVYYSKEKGFEASDKSRFGVVFAPDPGTVENELRGARMSAGEFTIAAGEANFVARARYEFEADGRIVSLMPVMGLRGKSVEVRALHPDGTEERLLSIPRWNPQWKFRYRLARPIAARAGTIVEAVAVFDNSAANIKNPDPGAEVKSGPGGEVFETWLGYSLD